MSAAKSAPPQWVFNFCEPPEADAARLRALVGGKGASLVEMTRAGLRVPPGFTVSTEACARYFENGRRWPEGLEEQVRENLAVLERFTGRTFGRGREPLLVSVRSGAAVSMPGMMDTLLNCGLSPSLAEDLGDRPVFWRLYIQFITMFAKTVAGLEEKVFRLEGPASREQAEGCLAIYAQHAGRSFPITPWDALVECINAVFCSWHNPRAEAYRQRHQIRGLSGTAVNVQAMFPSQVSGILFTQDPNDLPGQKMVVEASYGLGESVVSGDVTPDRFVVRRADFAQIQTSLGHKASVVAALGEDRHYDPQAASLTPAQIAELCKLALRVEELYGHAVDMEWGWADGQFALLQARPIRGLEVQSDAEAGRLAEVERLRRVAGGAHHVWVIHNLAETLRAPTPLTWDIVRRFMSGSGGFGLMYRDLGYQPSARVCEEGFLDLICGRIYMDPARLAELFWAHLPMGYDQEAVLADRRVLDRAPSKFEPERADGNFLLKLPGTLRAMLRSARAVKEARRGALERYLRDILPPFLEYVRQKRQQDLRALGTKELVAELRQRCWRALDEFGKEALKLGFFAGLAYDAVEARLCKLMGQAAGAQLARTLTSGLEGDSTYEQDLMLYEVAQGKAQLADFLERFGHRAAGEMELSEPRWREDPRYMEQTVARMRVGAGRAPAELHHGRAAQREAAEQELPQKLAEWGGSSFREEVLQDLREARALLPYRETSKDHLMRGYELIRAVIEELGRRLALGQDVYFLHLDELERFESEREELTKALAARKLRWRSAQTLHLPDVIDSAKVEQLGLPEPVKASAELRGDAVASGVATGVARVVFDPRQTGELGDAYILVCPSTDPGWTPLFVNARGLVVERGGVLSHGAIVARDFGLPAVVCPDATRLIRDGQAIRVDGNAGRIVLLDQEGVHA